MRPGRTYAEKVLAAHARGGARARDVRAGDVVVCEPDLVLGTDGSTPMAIDYFEAMGGVQVAHPRRVLLARDHYAPPTSSATRAFHARMVDFAGRHDIELLPVGGGISFLVALERDLVASGDLVVGGDSHTVSCGVAGAFATGVGSSDLAAAFLTGNVWLRVPDTHRVVLEGESPTGVGAKDVALVLVRRLARTVGAFTALEFQGAGADTMPPEERIVLTNMVAEMGAMAGVFATEADPEIRTDADAYVAKEIAIDVSSLDPMVALPHGPDQGVPVGEALGLAVDWVFLGTCAGGRVHDFREAARVMEAGGGVAPGLTVVVTPPTAAVREALERDGTLPRLRALGAVVTETGCGPCCGTTGPLPPPGAEVLSTANRNFRARMGEPSARIMLASPATCAAAATAGRVVDPREVA